MTEQEDKDTHNPQLSDHKLCTNCAYRATCNKRFHVTVANSQVICNDHAFDLNMAKASDSKEQE